jgi:predicted phage baseplate assembly protein
VPLVPPQLDDLSFSTVAELLRRQIPLYAPEWTDHNDSDPGITLIQLFAHLAEMIGYRLNQVPDKTYVEFLKLIGVRVRPAEAARTWLTFLLGKPETTQTVLALQNARMPRPASSRP